MTNPKAAGWIIGSAFVGVVILLLAWFLAISPTLATASETRAQVESQQNQNSQAQTKIDSLKKQFEKLDDIKAQLAQAQLAIPSSMDLAAYQDQLSAVAAAHSVTVTSVSFSAATPVTTVSAPTPTATPSATASSTETTAPAATSTSNSVQGFYGVPASIEIIGTYQNTLGLLQDLQTGTQRLLLVTGVSATSQTKAAAAGGKPATEPGDLDIVVTGQLYVYLDTTAAAAPAATGTSATPPALPVPDPARNPFKPLG